MLEKLKQIDVNKLSSEEVLDHKQQVLTLGQEDLINYLDYAVDNYYKTTGEGGSSETVDTFFKSEEFKPIYVLIQERDEEKENKE